MQPQFSSKVALISLASALLLACGSSSAPSQESPNKAGAGAGTGGGSALPSGGKGGATTTTIEPGSAGTPASTTTTPGGTAGAPITTGGAGNTDPVGCAPGAITCSGNLRVQRTATCEWVELPAEVQCQGATPACTGAGLCAAYRLVQGTIDTFGAPTGNASASYVLTHQTLLEYPTACNQKYCVSGGIQP